MAYRNPVENMGMGNLSNQLSMASRKNFITDINPGLKKGFNFVSTGLGNNLTKTKKGLMYDDEDAETSMYFQNHLYSFNPEKEYITSCSPLTFSNNSTYQSQARRRNDGYYNQFQNNISPPSYQTSTPPTIYGSSLASSALFQHNRSNTLQTASQSTTGSHPFGQNYTSVIGNNHNFSMFGKQRNLNSAFQQGSGFGSYLSSNFSNSKSGRYNENNPLGLDLSEFPSLKQTKGGGGMAVGPNSMGSGGGNSGSSINNNANNMSNNFDIFSLNNPHNSVLMNGNAPGMGLGSGFGGSSFNNNNNSNNNANSMALMAAAAQHFTGFGSVSNNLASALKGPYVGMVKQSVSEAQQEFQMHSEDFPALPGPQQSQSSLVKDALGLLDFNMPLVNSSMATTGETGYKLHQNQNNEQPDLQPSNSLPDHNSLLALKRGNFCSDTNVNSLFPPLEMGNSNRNKHQATLALLNNPPNPNDLLARNALTTGAAVVASELLNTNVLYPSSLSAPQVQRSNSTPLMDVACASSGTGDPTRSATVSFNCASRPGGPSVSDALALAQSSQAHQGIITHPDGRVTNIPASMVPGPFGMVGLLAFIRTAETQPNLVQLGLGSDLTTFGLNLNSSELLYTSFGGPFSETACKSHEIEYPVPSEYLIGSQIKDKLPPSPPLAKVGEDMLFFIFYAFTNDAIQLYAAQELYNRDWRFHLEERVWLIKIPGMHTSEKTPSYERGTYYFFDPQLWRKVPKEFLIYYNKLEDRPVVPFTNLLAPSLSTSCNSTTITTTNLPGYPTAAPASALSGKGSAYQLPFGYAPSLNSQHFHHQQQQLQLPPFSPFSSLTTGGGPPTPSSQQMMVAPSATTYHHPNANGSSNNNPLLPFNFQAHLQHHQQQHRQQHQTSTLAPGLLNLN